MKNNLLPWTGASACCAALLLSGCGQKHEAAPPERLPTASVRVQAVANKKHLATEEVVGTVRAKLRASIEAKVSGRIAQMPVVAGQTVKAGDTLARLEVREAQARLEQAKAGREQADRDRKRFETLLQQKAVTQQEYDAQDARFRIADASLGEAEAMLGYAHVTAPFDGVVSRKSADVGDLASPGRPLLELEDPRALRLEADVPEALLGRVQAGARMSVRVAALTNELEGVVSEIAPVADPSSRTFRVKLDLPSVAGLRPGQFGRVAVPLGETTTTRVPVDAVVQRGQMEMVFVIANQKAQMRLVKSGKRFGPEIELVSGVAPGELVATVGAAGLRDGQPVEVTK